MPDSTASDTDIAIIGMSSRFPDSKNTDEFWQNLQDGKECIAQISEDQLRAALLKSCGYIPEADLTRWLNDPHYVRMAAGLEDIDLFAATFFGYTPTEAEAIDPQQRIFLECAWEALEDAAYDPENYQGLIGIFAGSEMNTYHPNLHESIIPPVDNFTRVICNLNDYLATRVSYKLNLKGPGITVQTACSTSLVAVHLACQSLKSGECDIALAGGVVAHSLQEIGYFAQDDGFLSPDGHCRPFDAQASGIIFAHGGVGIVVLKHLEDALADGDNVYAIIKGSSVNNDGSLKAGYTAPSISGQIELILETMAVAAVDPASISYIEAHGTGTSLGDPIEVAALTQAFRTKTQRKRFCAIGSLKSNMGHLGAAAGVAGLIKTSLALKHRMIPPSLHYEQPNPQIDFANSPFYVNTQLTRWTTAALPRRAGVSSFGIGGTNAHVILEEAPDQCASPSLHDESTTRSRQLLILSAKTSSALEQMRVNLLDYLKNHPDLNLADLAFTLQVGRKAFPHRLMLVSQTIAETVSQLEAQQLWRSVANPGELQVAFLFPGQGAQYVNMGRELYEKEPIFRQQVETCARLLAPDLQRDLCKVIYPTTEQASGEQLHQTSMTQPALFVIEYALAQLLMKWGIHPQAMIGHSIGEYVAACLAGVFDLPDALELVALRGRLMQALPTGAMLSITLPEKDVEEFLGESLGENLGESLALAACNGPNESVVSGPTEAIELLEKHLREKGISSHRLRTSHAFHSQMMDPILERFTSAVSKRALHPPKTRYLSNITGTWITDQEATNPAYWAQHIRQTVRFTEGIQLLLDTPNMVLLEVGPGHSLSTLARQTSTGGSGQATDRFILSSLRHPQTQISDRAFLLNTCGQLWCAGVAIDWSHGMGQRRRISLPTYPFERERYWIFPMQQSHQENDPQRLHKEPDLARWFSVPSWKRSPLPAVRSEQSKHKPCWLIFTDSVGLGSRLVSHLRVQGEVVITVHVGTQFRSYQSGTNPDPTSLDSWEYTLRPESREDYDTLLKDMSSRGLFPTHIVHLWIVIATDPSLSGLDYFETAQALGFYSLLFLTQALGERKGEQPQEIAIISNNLQEVISGEVLCPVRATALGVGKVASREYPHITFRSIDIILPVESVVGEGGLVSTPFSPNTQLVDQIIAELSWRSSDLTVAYRGSHRWVQCIEPVQLPPATDEKLPLRQQGVYLITGGFGGIGMTLAEYLASQVKAKLVLTGRTALPEREEWDRRLATADGHDVAPGLASEASKIRQVKRLKELGAEVLVIEADVTNLEQMQAVISQVRERFGDLHGVIHTAGAPGGGLIQLKTSEAAAGVLAPKVKGTLVLEAVLKDLQPDFLVLCSSLASLIGEPGQVDYCAANTFLDHFAFYHMIQQRVKTISINWDIWQEIGMAVNTIKTYKKALRHLQNGILPQEGVEVFRRILINSAISQVIVATDGILARLEQVKSFRLSELQDGESGLEPPSATASSAQQRPNLQTPYVAPQNETQQQIATLWQQLLGIEKIGIHDNFLDLGGHSLLGIQLITRLRDMFRVDFTLGTFLEEPTVAGLAMVIVQKKAEFVDDAQLLQDIEDVESLTDDEAQAFLAIDMSQTGRTENI